MTDIIAHRGSKGTCPENTLISIFTAAKLGCEGIEIDVHLSKDKNLIVIHDETVDRTTNGSGYIKDMNLDEIKKLDAGSWFDKKYCNEKIPTLEEVVNLLNRENYKGFLNIEIKTDKIKYKKIEKILSEYLMNTNLTFKYIYSSFNLKSLKKIGKIDKTSDKAWLVKSVNITKKKMDKLESKYCIIGIHPKFKTVKNSFKLISKYTKNIRPWTVNKNDDIIKCFENNISGVITDYPEKALKLRKEYLENKKQEEICHL